MTYTFSGSEIDDNSFPALMLALIQNGSGSYKVHQEGSLQIIEFANGLKVVNNFHEGSGTEGNEPVQDDVYVFTITGADSEMYSH